MDLAELRREEKEALSDSDIQRLVGPTRIVTYPTLADARDFAEVPFDVRGRLFILFLTEDQFTGHWQLLHKPQEGVVELFDSYGGVDTPFSWLNATEERALGETEHHVSRLLKDAQRRGYRVQVSPVALQRKHGTSTCGKFCCVRAMLHDWPLANFIALLQSSGDPDLFVTAVVAAMEDSLAS